MIWGVFIRINYHGLYNLDYMYDTKETEQNTLPLSAIRLHFYSKIVFTMKKALCQP